MLKTKPENRVSSFELIAGNVGLDFINTLDNRPTAEPKELLRSFPDLARFAEQSGVLKTQDAKYLVGNSNSKRHDAADAVRRALELREALYAVFSAAIRRRNPPATAFFTLNSYVREAAQHSRLVRKGERYEWRFDDLKSSYDALLWPITRAAADLLASSDLLMVRACSAPTCQWFFLDTSKNHHRRWCSMRICGNRAKVRKFYAKQKPA